MKSTDNQDNLLCLKEFYEKTFPNGKCPKKALCDINNDSNFSKRPKEAYVGRNYGMDKNVPKILFVSLDSGEYEEGYSTFEEIRDREEKNPPLKVYGKGNHWYQTFDIAKLLLEPFLNGSFIKEEDFYSDSYFAHTNSAKCTQNKEGRAEADLRLFMNCREFVKSEIELYNADVIISQGNRANEIMLFFPQISDPVVFTANDSNRKLYVYERIINNKSVLHIRMYHPRYGVYWKQKKAIGDNIIEITKLIKSIITKSH